MASRHPGYLLRYAFQKTIGRLFIGAALVLTVGVGRASVGAPDKTDRIESLVNRYKELGYLNGSILVAEHGEVVYKTGIGDANMEAHSPNKPQTKFGIASITKQFTAALILQLAEQGKIQLDGKVTDYLSWYRKDTGEQITIEQLLHHTSGLPPDYDMPEFSDTPQAAIHYEPQAFAERFCQPNLEAKPGTKWAYSNCGYVLLGLILEKVSGKPFETLLNERILTPIGMKNTGMDRNDLPRLANGATGYLRHAGPRYTPGHYIDRSHIFSAGAMYSTVEDLFLWNQALSSDRLFSEKIRAQIFTPGMGHWACGWFVTHTSQSQSNAPATVAEMRGDMSGNYFAWILRYPDRDGLIIVLRNAYESTEHLEENLQAVLFDRPLQMPSRSPKDVFAHLWQTASSWSAPTGIALSLSAIILVTSGIRLTAGRRRIESSKLPPAA